MSLLTSTRAGPMHSPTEDKVHAQLPSDAQETANEAERVVVLIVIDVRDKE